MENLSAEVDINGVWAPIRENIKMSAKESLCYYDLKNAKNFSGYGMQVKKMEMI
jgi:hypothetical protein